jgi:GDP-4-dehydro-6-deoxy-D-mannose reductase
VKCCLVTGAGGFVARYVIPRLAKQGWQVVGTARRQDVPRWLAAADYVSLDIRDAAAVDEVLRTVRPDALINLVAGSGGAADLCRTHVSGVCNLLASVQKHVPECRVVLTGSAAEYGAVPAADMPVSEDTPCAPAGAYGVTKLAASELALEWARAWRLPVAVVRPFNIVGPGVPQRLLVGALIARVRDVIAGKAGSTVRVGNVETIRDFVAVQDVADAMVSLVSRPEIGGVFNLCSGQGVSVREVLEKILSFSPKPLEWSVDPQLLRPDDVPVSYGTYARAQAAFGFKPTIPLERTLRETWDEQVGQ